MKAVLTRPGPSFATTQTHMSFLETMLLRCTAQRTIHFIRTNKIVWLYKYTFPIFSHTHTKILLKKKTTNKHSETGGSMLNVYDFHILLLTKKRSGKERSHIPGTLYPLYLINASLLCICVSTCSVGRYIFYIVGSPVHDFRP